MESHSAHLIELTGLGGIFQHTIRLAQILAGSVSSVTVHTSPRHEPVELGGVQLCTCSPWRRRVAGSTSLKAQIATRFAVRTLPHLVRATGRDGVAHVQGLPSVALTTATMAAMRGAGRAVVFTPHRTYSRRGSRLETALIESCARLAAANIAFSRADADVLRRWSPSTYLSPLVLLVPEPEPSRVAGWRRAWQVRDGDRVVLFAGQIRREKRLDLLIESAARWTDDLKLAVVGEDRGDWERCAALASRLGVHVHATPNYVSLDDFVAAVAASDVVVSPYDQANQSAVLALAVELGVPTVASRVGGLDELSTEAVPPGDTDALARAIDVASRRPRTPDRLLSARALDVHLRAYRLAAGVPP